MIWQNGTITIELDSSKHNFESGEVIHGSVNLNQKSEFKGTQLVVGLIGFEQTYFIKGDGSDEFNSKQTFLNAEIPIHLFES